MVVDERTRHGLFEQLIAVLGEEHAVTLMEHLPPVGWADVATKHDLTALKSDLEERLRAEINRLAAEIGSTQAEIGSTQRELRAEISSTQRELRAEIASMRHELVGLFRAELAQTVTAQTRP